jgi:hypothetical protein
MSQAKHPTHAPPVLTADQTESVRPFSGYIRYKRIPVSAFSIANTSIFHPNRQRTRNGGNICHGN